MKFEHLALNVKDSRAVAQWYVDHLQMKIIRSIDEAPYTRFLADSTGRPILELYSPATPLVPDYAGMHALTLHLAFAVADARAVAAKLEAAGAKVESKNEMPNGNVMVMMRDPWGFTLQIWQRIDPL